MIPSGIYRHFKGGLYEVYETAIHSETGEEYVVYRALYGSKGLFIRPVSMFDDSVDRIKYPNAIQEKRFMLIEKRE